MTSTPKHMFLHSLRKSSWIISLPVSESAHKCELNYLTKLILNLNMIHCQRISFIIVDNIKFHQSFFSFLLIFIDKSIPVEQTAYSESNVTNEEWWDDCWFKHAQPWKALFSLHIISLNSGPFFFFPEKTTEIPFESLLSRQCTWHVRSNFLWKIILKKNSKCHLLLLWLTLQ